MGDKEHEQLKPWSNIPYFHEHTQTTSPSSKLPFSLMSDKSLRRRSPSTNRRLRPSLSSRRLGQPSTRKLSRPIEIPKRSRSESNLVSLVSGHVSSGDGDRAGEEGMYRPRTCTDIFSPGGSFSLPSPGSLGGYKKDAKVVVNVTVEGSPGPVRTLVKLGANVDETIRLVINKYNQEGRTPPLDKDAALYFQLHHSHFSLSSLSKLDVIGDVGSRSFYLCRNNNNNNNSTNRSNSARDIIPTSFTSGVVLARSNTPPPSDPSHFSFASTFFCQRIEKFLRRSCKLWKIFGCLTCN